MAGNDKISRSELRSKLIWIGCMLICLLLIFRLKTYPEWVEKYYSQGVYPIIRRGFQFIFNYSPISIGDLLYITCIIFLSIGVYQLIKLLVGRKFRRAGLLLLGFVLKLEVAIIAFYMLWAINYFRQPASERLKLQDYEYNIKDLVKVTSMLIDSANVSRSAIQPSDLLVSDHEILVPALQAIQKLSSFDPPLTAIKPMAKRSLLSFLLNYIGTAGYYNPFTGEAQYNSMMPAFTKPFVACHEMAHQMGFGAEDEANFAGFIAGKSSDNRLLKYSAYYLAGQEFMTEVWRADSTAFKQLKGKISPAVLMDLETERAYWTKYQGGAARISSIFYDNYLKANKQPEGLKTYNRMIKLSMAYYRKTGFIP